MSFQKRFYINKYPRVKHARLAYFIVLCSVLMSLASCVQTLKPYVTYEKTINMGGYTIDRPPEEGWKTVITAKDQRIDFSRETTDRDGNALSKISIMVRTQWAKDKTIWKLSKKEIANKYLEGERSGLKFSAALGIIKIEDDKEKTIYVDDKKLYNGYIKHTSTKGDVIIEMNMYLYFPQDYKRDDKFIIFLVSEGYKSERNEPADLSAILPIIKSLQIDLEKLN